MGLDPVVAGELVDEDASEESGWLLEEAGLIRQKPKAIGYMEIDKIDLKLPVAEGTDLATLKFSLGHMPGTAGLGTTEMLLLPATEVIALVHTSIGLMKWLLVIP